MQQWRRRRPTGQSVRCIVESAFAATSPQHQHLIAIVTAQPRRDLDQRAEDHRAIIVGQLDQAGFRDQSAELDQMPGSLAPLHDPVARITAASRRQ